MGEAKRRRDRLLHIEGGPLCPYGDGRHKLLPWAGGGRSGLACTPCGKSWERGPDGALVATYKLRGWGNG